MKLSKDAIEALILLGGFGIVASAGYIVFRMWPAHIYGDWRVFLTLIVGALIAIPTMLALKKKWAPPSE